MSTISETLIKMVQTTPISSSIVTKENSKEINKSSIQSNSNENMLNQLGLAIKRR